MNASEHRLYTGKVRTTGGREGTSRSSDGRLDIQLSSPGGRGSGTNPEQLFAAGWSACFEGALARAAHELVVEQQLYPTVEAEIDLMSGKDGFFLRARLNVSLPGLDRALALRLVEHAHRLCPYSKATRGNIGVVTSLV